MTILPKPLKVRDWPEFALAPWRDAQGALSLSDDKRHALGRYLAWLRAEDLPFETTGQEPALRYLGALEARMATKPAFHVALCHLMTALAKIHPSADWSWLCDWRRSWRARFMPPPGEGYRDLGFPPLPFADWPAETQRLWQAQVPTEWPQNKQRSYRAAYGRFLGFCAHRGRSINHGQPTLEAYLACLAARLPKTGHNHARALQVSLAVLFPSGDWSSLTERARDLRPSPTRAVRRRPDRRLSVPFEAWPREDQERWRRTTTPPAATSRLEQLRRRRQDPGTAADSPRGMKARKRRGKPPYCWSEALLTSAQYAYGSFLTTMRDLERADAEVTPDTVALWVEAMRPRMTIFSLGSCVHHLVFALRILRPQQDWEWLRRDADLLHDAGAPAHDKISEIVDVAEIRKAAINRLRRVEGKPKTVAAALEFQDGIIMLLLAYRPVRRRNLAETRLGVNLLIDENGSSGTLLYERTKMGRRYDVGLPEKLLPWLKLFLEVYRPLLADAESINAAWLSRAGTPLAAKRIWRRIRRATEQELGKSITLHRFRDCLASTVSEMAPEHIEDAARLLGHRTQRGRRRSGHRYTPAIEIYRQRSGTTMAARRLAEIADHHRHPRPTRRSKP